MRMLFGAALAAVMLAGCAAGPSGMQSASSAAMAMPEITVYHLEGRRSERIVWLMEELGL